MKIYLRSIHFRPFFLTTWKYRKTDNVEREGRLEMDQYDLLFLLKHKQWDTFWQLISFIFLNMLLGKRNDLFQ